jgi:hypothetical protein
MMGFCHCRHECNLPDCQRCEAGRANINVGESRLFGAFDGAIILVIIEDYDADCNEPRQHSPTLRRHSIVLHLIPI